MKKDNNHFVFKLCNIKIKMSSLENFVMFARGWDFADALIYLKGWGILTTHLLTHTFQHTLFDWLKFTWDPPKVYTSFYIIYLLPLYTYIAHLYHRFITYQMVLYAKAVRSNLMKFRTFHMEFENIATSI